MTIEIRKYDTLYDYLIGREKGQLLPRELQKFYDQLKSTLSKIERMSKDELKSAIAEIDEKLRCIHELESTEVMYLIIMRCFLDHKLEQKSKPWWRRWER